MTSRAKPHGHVHFRPETHLFLHPQATLRNKESNSVYKEPQIGTHAAQLELQPQSNLHSDWTQAEQPRAFAAASSLIVGITHAQCRRKPQLRDRSQLSSTGSPLYYLVLPLPPCFHHLHPNSRSRVSELSQLGIAIIETAK